jgi:putative ABC transport system permease protein
MDRLRQLLHHLRSFFRGAKLDRDLDAEMAAHLQFAIEDNLNRGLSPSEARRQALLRFGGPQQAREQHREARGLPLLDALLQDLRFGLRMLTKNPGFTCVAVLTLALGIGATTSIFSATHALLLKSLPYPDSSRLVYLWCRQPSRNIPELPPSIPDYWDWQRQLHSFSAIAGYWGAEFAISGGPEPRRALAVRAFPSYFEVLAMPPLRGRTFTPDDQQWGNHRVVVISYGLWKSFFAGNPEVVGRQITMDAEPYKVIGVMPPEFTALNPRVQLWVPAAVPPNITLRRIDRFMRVIGRLKPGISQEQASLDLRTVMAGLAATYDEDKGVETYLVPAQRQLTDARTREALFVLLAAVGFLLLIASVNIANLLLARAAAREKELAVRAALGAGRVRLLWQLMVEHLLLALVGGGAGTLLAAWGTAALRSISVQQVPRAATMSLDATVLWFALGLSLFTGLLFGALPAFHASRVILHESLSQGSRGSGGSMGSRSRSALVVLETALAVALLTCAGLLINSFYHLRSVDPGFSANHLLVAEFDLPEVHYSNDQSRRDFFRDLLARVSELPGVTSAGATETLPLHQGNHFWTGFERQEHPLASWENMPVVAFLHATPGYFATMKIPVLRGRVFSDEDRPNTEPVAVISESLHRRFFDSENPIGRRIRLGVSTSEPWLTVIGVVGNVSQEGLDREQPPIVYAEYAQGVHGVPGDMLVVMRANSDPLALSTLLRARVSALDHDLAIAELTTMSNVVGESLDQPRLTMLLLSLFAGLAVLLAAVGVYGVLSYIMARCTHEIGVRMALGAHPGAIARLVLGRGAKLTAAGVSIGIGAAALATRLMRGLLFGVSPIDPLTFVSAAMLLTLIALTACYLPARRATKVDPMVALRYE